MPLQSAIMLLVAYCGLPHDHIIDLAINKQFARVIGWLNSSSKMEIIHLAYCIEGLQNKYC